MSPAACCSVVQPVEPVAGFAALVGVGEDQDRVRLHRVDDAVRVAEVLQTHSPVNMRVRAVSVYSHLWTVTLPTVRPFSTNSCASRSVVGEIGASVVVAVVRMRP